MSGFFLLFLGGLLGGTGYFRLMQADPSANFTDLALNVTGVAIGAICIIAGMVLTKRDVPGGRQIAILFGVALFIFGGVFRFPWIMDFTLKEQIQVVLNLLFGAALTLVTWIGLRD